MRLNNPFPPRHVQCQAAVVSVADFKCADFDVLALDLENVGTGALTGLQIHARVSPDAPYRNVTPESYQFANADVIYAAPGNGPSLVPNGGYLQFSIDVRTFESVILKASGASATLRINAGGYSESGAAVRG